MRVELSTLRGQNRDAEIAGAIRNNDVYLPILTPIDFLGSFWHEFGHPIGNNLSFLKGEVLTPDEVKTTRMSLDLFTKTRLLYLLAINKPKRGLGDILVPVATEILNIFTRGNFDISKYIVHFDYPYDTLLNDLKAEANNVTYSVDTEGEIVLLSSKNGRNVELSPIVVEAGCTGILANSLPLLNLSFGTDYFHNSHERAWSIVHRAYDKSGYIIPSQKDLLTSSHPLGG